MNKTSWWFLVTWLAAVDLAGASSTRPEAPDAIVVLGHHPALADGGVEYETRARVELGVKLYRQTQGAPLLMTGGKSSEGAIEADVMAEYAESLGVPGEHILRERQSHDTIENARLTVALLRRRLGGDHAPRVALVTSDYHIERATRLFRCAGAEVSPHSAKLTLSRVQRTTRNVREWLVGVTYWFVDECERAEPTFRYD